MRKTVIALLVLGLIALGGWWLVLRHDAPLSLHRNKGSSTTQQQMSSGDVQRFETALGSTDRNQQASVMSPDLRTAYLAQGQSLLPAGGHVKLKPDTLTVNGNAAHVEASFTANGTSSTYTLVLIRTDSHSPWLLANTEGK